MNNARIMVADSTMDVKTKGRKRKNSAKKKKTHKMRKSEDREDKGLLDLTIQLFPISGYIRQPEALINNMFDSVRGNTLRGLLPEILKDVPEADLKASCLAELEVMSKKRVKRIIQGENPDEISSSGTDDDLDLSEDEVEDAVEEVKDVSAAGLENVSVDKFEKEDEDVHSEDNEPTSDGSVSQTPLRDDDVMSPDPLDGVSSTDSPSYYREIDSPTPCSPTPCPIPVDSDSRDDDVEEPHLQIVPRRRDQEDELEEGEVMSSDDEDIDPTWRKRGEEAVKREMRFCEPDSRSIASPSSETNDSIFWPKSAPPILGGYVVDESIDGFSGNTDAASESHTESLGNCGFKHKNSRELSCTEVNDGGVHLQSKCSRQVTQSVADGNGGVDEPVDGNTITEIAQGDGKVENSSYIDNGVDRVYGKNEADLVVEVEAGNTSDPHSVGITTIHSELSIIADCERPGKSSESSVDIVRTETLSFNDEISAELDQVARDDGHISAGVSGEGAITIKEDIEDKRVDDVQVDKHDDVADDVRQRADSTPGSDDDGEHEVFVVTEDISEFVKVNNVNKRKHDDRSDRSARTDANSDVEPISKSQLEILELEMRARAIKAMLKAQDRNDDC